MRSIVFMPFVLTFGAAGCAPEVGSDAWCAKQKERPKGEWTLDESSQYTRYCVLGFDSEKWCKKLERKPKGEWTANEGIEYAKSCLMVRNEG